MRSVRDMNKIWTRSEGDLEEKLDKKQDNKINKVWMRIFLDEDMDENQSSSLSGRYRLVGPPAFIRRQRWPRRKEFMRWTNRRTFILIVDLMSAKRPAKGPNDRLSG